MSIIAYLNKPTPLSAQTSNGDDSLFPRSIIKDKAGALISTVDMMSTGQGHYLGSWTPTKEGVYSVTQIPYADSTHTTISTSVGYGIDIYEVVPRTALIDVSVPQSMYSKTTTTVPFIISCDIKDQFANGIAADSSPTIEIKNSSGALIVSGTMVPSSGPGNYQYIFNVPVGLFASILVTVTATVDGITTKTTEASNVGIETTASYIPSKQLDDIAYRVWEEVLPGVHDIATTAGGFVQVIEETVEQTDNEVMTGPQSLASIYNAVLSTSNVTVDEIHQVTEDLTELINNQTDAIRGPDNVTNTDIYNNLVGQGDVLMASDPRLDFLDAFVSSRSTLTDVAVWSYSFRTLTGTVPINSTDIWGALTSSMTTVGSIGQLLATNVDLPISSIWTQPNRSLTFYPPFATTTDVINASNNTVSRLDNHECFASTSIEKTNAKQQILAFLNINGETVTTPTSATLTIYEVNNVLWTATVTTHDTAGVFRADLNATGLYQPGRTYTMLIAITYNGIVYRSIQPFSVVN